jgi:cytochrome bd ubiquinol oxidase subunit II
MSLDYAVTAVLLLGVTAYALFGGSDFGAGFWDLVAGGAERGDRPRRLIEHSIGPVWEANHVWLIFCLVVLYTAFPTTFSAVMTTLFFPFVIAALGIVLRGSSFAFRKVTRASSRRRPFGAVFAISSVLVPYSFGAVAGAIASGRVLVSGKAPGPWSSWINPTSAIGGVLAVSTCAYMAAVLLVDDARRSDNGALVEYFRIRALCAAVVTGGVSIAGIFVIHSNAHFLFDGLTGRALPLVVIAAVCGTGSLILLLFGVPIYPRVLAAGAVVSVIWGWGVAQWPYLVPRTISIQQGAAPSGTLWEVLVVAAVAAFVLVPSFGFLYTLTQRSLLEDE